MRAARLSPEAALGWWSTSGPYGLCSMVSCEVLTSTGRVSGLGGVRPDRPSVVHLGTWLGPIEVRTEPAGPGRSGIHILGPRTRMVPGSCPITSSPDDTLRTACLGYMYKPFWIGIARNDPRVLAINGSLTLMGSPQV